MLNNDVIQALIQECDFSFSRSSGPGGQNVNKVNSKMELRFSLPNSLVLSEIEKEKLQIKLANRINSDGELVLYSQESRSQIANKELVIRKFVQSVMDALKEQKKRKPTKPTKSSILKRLESKKRLSERKQSRKKL